MIIIIIIQMIMMMMLFVLFVVVVVAAAVVVLFIIISIYYYSIILLYYMFIIHNCVTLPVSTLLLLDVYFKEMMRCDTLALALAFAIEFCFPFRILKQKEKTDAVQLNVCLSLYFLFIHHPDLSNTKYNIGFFLKNNKRQKGKKAKK